MTSDQLHQLEFLLVRYFEQNLQQEEMECLNAILSRDEVAQEYYFDYLKTQLALKQVRPIGIIQPNDRSFYQKILEEMALYERNASAIEVKNTCLASMLKQETERSKSEFKIGNLLFKVAFAVVMLLLLLLLFEATRGRKELPIAFIEDAIGAKWESVSGKISEGDALFTGPMKLNDGCVKIKFLDGGCIFMQAPIEFTLESPHQVFLQSGRLTASLHNAQKQTFMVRTMYCSIVDYGTEFGVSICPDGVAEAHVFQGKIQIRDSSDPIKFVNSLFVEEGQGATTELSGGILKIRPKEVDFRQFVQPEEFFSQCKATQGSSFHRWLAYSYYIQREPSLVAYYQFEKNDQISVELINSGPLVKDSFSTLFGESDQSGTIPTWAEGRWPQTSALQFDRFKKQRIRVVDHPRLRIAGPITIAAWVKLLDTGDAQGGLLLSNRTLNHINYQLVLGKRPSHGKMMLAFGRYAKHLDPKVHSELFEMKPQTWYHIAVTHDNSLVQFYINGKPLSSVIYPFKQDPVEADLYIGFTPISQSAGFHGMLDELFLFDRALSNQEILYMYSQTKTDIDTILKGRKQ